MGMATRKILTKEGKSEPKIIARYELLDRINSINSGTKIRDQAFISFVFLTGCRVSEVTNFYEEKLTPGNRFIKEISIKKKQISVDFDKDLMMIYNVRTLKKQRLVYRNIPVIISKERDILAYFFRYLDKLTPEQMLFPFTRQRAYQIVSGIGLYNHYLRHLRLTDLTIRYNFSAHHLKNFVHWSSINPSDSYVHLNIQDLIDKMKR